jgi:hypothetical protein
MGPDLGMLSGYHVNSVSLACSELASCQGWKENVKNKVSLKEEGKGLADDIKTVARKHSERQMANSLNQK